MNKLLFIFLALIGAPLLVAATTVELRTAAFFPTDGRFRSIYGETAPCYQIQATTDFCGCYEGWVNFDYFTKQGKVHDCGKSRVDSYNLSFGPQYTYLTCDCYKLNSAMGEWNVRPLDAGTHESATLRLVQSPAGRISYGGLRCRSCSGDALAPDRLVDVVHCTRGGNALLAERPHQRQAFSRLDRLRSHPFPSGAPRAVEPTRVCLCNRRAFDTRSAGRENRGAHSFVRHSLPDLDCSKPRHLSADQRGLGGPTGASQLESSLVIVAILLLLPFGLTHRKPTPSQFAASAWIMIAAEAASCLALGRADVSHHRPIQFLSLGSLLSRLARF